MGAGTYALVLFLPDSRKFRIGALGFIAFPKGYYVYVGSGLNGLESRVLRHLSKKKKVFWHIDYFIPHTRAISVLMVNQKRRLECKISRACASVADRIILKFGCSDCRCGSHLFYFKKNPVNKISFIFQRVF